MNNSIYSDSVLNVEVSLFANYKTTKNPVTINLLNILQSNDYQKAVEEIRRLDDKAQIAAKKATLPAFTPSGIFTQRKDDNLVQHSKLIQIDIDYKDNKHLSNYANLKNELCKIINVAFCSPSVSGTGYYCLIPIKFPEKHRVHFKALHRIFKDLGLHIDEQCINVSRLRGVSYDPDAYFNHYAVPFELLEQPAKVVQMPDKMIKSEIDKDSENIERYITVIEKRRIDITDGYKNWLKIGCSLSNTFGESGRTYFHRLSVFNPTYRVNDTDEQYDKCLKSDYSISIATFFHYCKEAGINA